MIVPRPHHASRAARVSYALQCRETLSFCGIIRELQFSSTTQYTLYYSTVVPSKLFDTMPCFCLHVSSPKRRQSSHAGKTGSSIPTPGFRLIRDPDASKSAIAGRHERLQQSRRSGEVDIFAGGTSGGLHQLAVDDSELDVFPPQGHTANNFLKALSAKLVNTPLKSKKKRRSYISIGKSEAEVARRAELKRLMHKRIQDELLHNTKDVDTERGDKDKALSPGYRLDSVIPVCGPRDHLEFDMAQHKNAPSAANGCIGDNCLPDQHSSFNQVRRQKSCPASVLGLDFDSVCGTRTGVKNGGGCVAAKTLRSSQSCMGNLAARHLGRVLPEKTSLEHHLLRVKDLTDLRRSQTHSWDSQSALGIWLIAQGLHERDGSALTLPKADANDPAVSPSRLSSDLGPQKEKALPKGIVNKIQSLISVSSSEEDSKPPLMPQ